MYLLLIYCKYTAYFKKLASVAKILKIIWQVGISILRRYKKSYSSKCDEYVYITHRTPTQLVNFIQQILPERDFCSAHTHAREIIYVLYMLFFYVFHEISKASLVRAFFFGHTPIVWPQYIVAHVFLQHLFF